MVTHTSLLQPQARRRPGAEGFRIRLVSDSPGIVEMPALPHAIVSVHVGPPTRMWCGHGNQRQSGVAIHGDVEIIPAGTRGSWELKQKDTALVMSFPRGLLQDAAEASGLDSTDLELKTRFHERDHQIEHIAWALKAEMDAGYPCGRLYRDSLAMALAVHLLRHHGTLARPLKGNGGKMPPRKLQQVLLYIDANLGEDLSLAKIARVAGVSVSYCNALFRAAAGCSIHQYVIRRKVQRAAWMLEESELPVGQVAMEAGFAHQSHLSAHMRRLMGTTPKKLRARYR